MSRLGVFVFTLSLTFAQPPFELDAPAVWLEPFSPGVAALLASGDVILFEDGNPERLAAAWQGDTLVTCDGNLVGIDESGRLAVVGTALSGPKVAPHSRPLCLDNRVFALSPDATTLYRLDADLTKLHNTNVNALPDADLVASDMTGNGQKEVILLTDPTERYTHGVLGDGLEATGIAVYNAATLSLVASYTLAAPYVFEQRRVTPFAFGDKEGVLATRSSNETGAGVVLLSLEADELIITAKAAAIGTGFRWLNLFASRNGRAYAVRTPHIGGPLQRYSLDGDTLNIEAFQLGVTNHVIGSRNLDLGVLLPELKPGVDHLVLPSQSLRSLRLVRCDAESCQIADEFELGARLSSHLAFVKEGQTLRVMAADEVGRLHLWTIKP